MGEPLSAYDELYAYTMGLPRPPFILQHVVDAHHAQGATSGANSIGLVFSLAGLYLHVERGFDGLQVQRVHQLLGARKRVWPDIQIPSPRGDMTAVDVMKASAGTARDAAIDAWCANVWAAFQSSRHVIIELLRQSGIT